MPTLQNLRRAGSTLAIPGKRFGAAKSNVFNISKSGSMAFRSQPFSTTSLYLTGITKDSTGATLGSVTVDLYRTENGQWIARTISDASGNFSFQILVGGPFFIVAYKAGSPDVTGTTVNTLVGS